MSGVNWWIKKWTRCTHPNVSSEVFNKKWIRDIIIQISEVNWWIKKWIRDVIIQMSEVK